MTVQSTTRRHFLQHLTMGAGGLMLAPPAFGRDVQPGEQTILFLGDSITHAGGYVRIIAEVLEQMYPDNATLVINRGKSSETVSGLSEAYHPGVRPTLFDRLDDELKTAKPDWVVACYGINCGIYHPFDEERFAAYKAGIRRLIESVHAAGSHLVLLTSPPYAKAGPAFPNDIDDATREEFLAAANKQAQVEADNDSERFGYRTPYAYYDQVMARYAAWLMTMEALDDVWVINLREAMLSRLEESYDSDPIHPNETGHGVMANSFLTQWPRIEEEARDAGSGK